jgi:NitT/TauT family transport system substrate-binding protein
MNSALLSGSLDFAAQGIPGLVTLWARTAGTPQEVKGVAALSSLPMYLNTRNPNVMSVKDFTDRDRIAVPSIKVSVQAVTLQMAAEQAFGAGNFAKLDRLTVSLGHPDAQIALLSGKSDITAHLSSPPFQYEQLKQPGIHKVLDSYEVLGGPASFNVIVTTKKFRDANPKTYNAFFAALKEAVEAINRDKKAAAQRYLEWANDRKSTLDEVYAAISSPDYAFTLMPEKVFKTAEFMAKIGSVKDKPASWKDMFFPEVHNLPGN